MHFARQDTPRRNRHGAWCALSAALLMLAVPIAVDRLGEGAPDGECTAVHAPAGTESPASADTRFSQTTSPRRARNLRTGDQPHCPATLGNAPAEDVRSCVGVAVAQANRGNARNDEAAPPALRGPPPPAASLRSAATLPS